MSDKYRKVEQYKCLECGKVHGHPSLAESCWFTDRMLAALEDADNHVKLSRSEMLKDVEKKVEEGGYDYEPRKKYRVWSHFGGDPVVVKARSPEEAIEKAPLNRPERVEETDE